MESDGSMLLGLKGRESRHRRSHKLRKNRRDADLEKKARTGQRKLAGSQLRLDETCCINL